MSIFAYDDPYILINYLLRWIHIISGITWIGLLYFFNFINGPFQASIPKEIKPQVNPQLLPRALFFFRWGAMFTWLFGLILFFHKYMVGRLIVDAADGISDRTIWILWGMAFGTIMWFNVWFIIWPAQKKLIGWMRAGESPEEAPALAKRATSASKMNTYLSGPMLFFMIAPEHHSTFAIGTWVIVLVVGFGAIKMLYTLSKNVSVEV